MNKQLSPNLSWREGANYLSPVQKVLAFGHYDGPTDGVLQCGDGQTYRFDLLAWDKETQDVRVFALSPLPRPEWERLIALCTGREAPRWPVWAFRWQEPLRQPIEDLLRRAGPVEWALATEDLLGEILRVKAVRPEERVQVTNWGAFLGLAQELPARNPQ
jgi:hypothetical protein